MNNDTIPATFPYVPLHRFENLSRSAFETWGSDEAITDDVLTSIQRDLQIGEAMEHRAFAEAVTLHLLDAAPASVPNEAGILRATTALFGDGLVPELVMHQARKVIDARFAEYSGRLFKRTPRAEINEIRAQRKSENQRLSDLDDDRILLEKTLKRLKTEAPASMTDHIAQIKEAVESELMPALESMCHSIEERPSSIQRHFMLVLREAACADSEPGSGVQNRVCSLIAAILAGVPNPTPEKAAHDEDDVLRSLYLHFKDLAVKTD